jgi:alpha-D-ribose 1-methylphosphonate 5-triphosphate synthase subunit PhnH
VIPASALAGGLADPVFDSQRIFRGVLDALSRPGRIVDPGAPARAPEPLMPGTAAILAALADDTTPVWLDAAASAGAGPSWVGFQTGAPVVPGPGDAALAVIADAGAMPPFADFALGTAEYPDRSATLIVQVATLDGGPALVLAGPGIKGTAGFAPEGLPADFLARMGANRALFPRGVDLFLVAGSRIAGLPRSVIVREGG